MNKQELIGDYKRISNFCETVSVNKVIQELEQLTEPQKVQVPQFVAEWIEECKENNIISLSGAFEYAKEEVEAWLSSWENQEIFALAWINGYEVEKEKRYYIRLKNVDENYNYLTCIKHLDAWVLTEIKRDKKFRTEHTKKQLEEGGFGEVFDSPLFEVEEVEE
jgi:phage protein